MSTWKAALAVLAVFVLGTIFGAAISYWIPPRIGSNAPPAREILTQRLNRRLVRELSLSAEQEKAIAGIIQEARDQLGEIRKETRPRVRQVIMNARDRIRAQLNPEQQARFDQIRERNQRLFNRFLDSK